MCGSLMRIEACCVLGLMTRALYPLSCSSYLASGVLCIKSRVLCGLCCVLCKVSWCVCGVVYYSESYERRVMCCVVRAVDCLRCMVFCALYVRVVSDFFSLCVGFIVPVTMRPFLRVSCCATCVARRE